MFLEVILQMQKTYLSEIPEAVSKSFICIKSLVVLEAVISSPLNAQLREQLNWSTLYLFTNLSTSNVFIYLLLENGEVCGCGCRRNGGIYIGHPNELTRVEGKGPSYSFQNNPLELVHIVKYPQIC